LSNTGQTKTAIHQDEAPAPSGTDYGVRSLSFVSKILLNKFPPDVGWAAKTDAPDLSRSVYEIPL
jgi:hypothetical protein